MKQGEAEEWTGNQAFQMEGDNIIAEHSTGAFWEQGGLCGQLSNFLLSNPTVRIIQVLAFCLFVCLQT